MGSQNASPLARRPWFPKCLRFAARSPRNACICAKSSPEMRAFAPDRRSNCVCVPKSSPEMRLRPPKCVRFCVPPIVARNACVFASRNCRPDCVQFFFRDRRPNCVPQFVARIACNCGPIVARNACDCGPIVAPGSKNATLCPPLNFVPGRGRSPSSPGCQNARSPGSPPGSLPRRSSERSSPACESKPGDESVEYTPAGTDSAFEPGSSF